MHKYKTAKNIKGGGGIGGGNCYFDGEAMALGRHLAMKPLLRTLTPLLLMLGLTSLAFVVLSATRTHAAETATASVTVPVSCTITATPSNGGNATMNGGTYNAAAVETKLGAACNDNGGYSVYAIGYSGDASGNSNSTSMIGPSVSGAPLLIPSCTGDNCASTVPDSSRWAMKLTSISGTSTPTILGGYDGFSSIPLESTKVITYPSSTSVDDRSETKATYAVAISSAQPSGTYTGKVKYTIVHPNYANADGTVPLTMQDATSSSLATLMPNVGDTAILVDSRDGSNYTVAKLADGHYWMTQNLRLGKGNGEEIVLTSSDSNVSSNFTLKASGMGSNSPDATGDCNVGDWWPEGSEEEINATHLCINTDDTEKYGVYYNWYTATAGTGTYSMSSGDASGSICPKGWILPPNSGERSYYNLLFTKAGLSSNAASSTTMQGAPYNFPLSGGTYGGGVGSVGDTGVFWSSSAYDTDYAYRLSFNSSRIYPQNYDVKGYGRSVRCVFDDRSIADATYMQDVTAEMAEGTEIGASKTLIDSRDSKSYSVAKLADGKIWMTSNLNLAGGTALSPADTDVTSAYIEGFTSGNGLTKSGNTIVLPSSSSSFSMSDNNLAVVYNSGRTTCSSDSTTGSCYSYYSFPAATLGAKDLSGSTTVTGNGYNTAASICPKGWRLPTATTSNASPTSGTNYQTGDFWQMATQYGLSTGSYYENPDNAPTFYSQAGPGTTPNFLLSGYYGGGVFGDGGSRGYYWSSTSISDNSAYFLYFYSGYVRSAGINYRASGFAVRCIYDGQ